MKYLKFAFLLITFLSNSGISAQVDRSISFDSCFVYGRQHPDSVFRATGVFTGDGSFDFYRDSIIVTYSNEWESGKYFLELEGLDGEIDGDNFIWYYKGHDKYRGWGVICMLVVDPLNQPIYLEMFSEYAETKNFTYAKTTRVYTIQEPN